MYAYTYEYTYTNLYPISTSEGLRWQITRFTNHHRRLAANEDVAYYSTYSALKF